MMSEFFLEGILGFTGAIWIKIFSNQKQSIKAIFQENEGKAELTGLFIWITIIAAGLSFKFIYFK